MKPSCLPNAPLAGASEQASERCVPLVTPAKLRRDLPLSEKAKQTVANTRRAVADLLSGQDAERMLVVCGPCSIDDVNAALVYAERLKKLADALEDRLVIVMRTYFEKPRSVVGWKGLAYEPLSEEQLTPSSGLVIARRLAARINEIGIGCATEFLNPLVAMYLEDCVAYGSIGSRTVESQVHRELSSRLAMPIGMKNGMDGGIDSAVNAVRSAQAKHSSFGQNLSGEPCIVETAGNQSAHLILRGGSNGANYDSASVGYAVSAGQALGVARPVLVDCSHGNSGKDHRRQPAIAEEVSRQFVAGQKGIAGIMLESYLQEGRQDADSALARAFGLSITDACIGWTDTEKLLSNLAEKLS